MEEKNNVIKVLEELKSLISSDMNMDYNYIALFYYLKLIATKNEEYNQIKNQSAGNISCVLQIDYGSNIDVKIAGFDYENKMLMVDVKIGSNISRVCFYKNSRDNISACNDNCGLGYDILSMMDSNILKLYNDILLYEPYVTSSSTGINIGDTNFYADVSFDNVIIYYGKNKDISDFVLEIDSNLNYSYKGNNDDLINQFKNNEDRLMNKMHVEIEKLPEWSHSYMYGIKSNQIIAEEEKRKEAVREQKRSEFLGKITSIFKKR